MEETKSPVVELKELKGKIKIEFTELTLQQIRELKRLNQSQYSPNTTAVLCENIKTVLNVI